MEIGDQIIHCELPYKIISEIKGAEEDYYVLEPIHESSVIRSYTVIIKKKV